FWVAEHLVMPAAYTTYYPRSADGKVPDFYAHLIDPFVALSIAAHATSRIKLATGICLLTERNVIETAKATASLDLYSNGRFIMGAGAGWFPEEAQIMGLDFVRRWKRMRESIEALRMLWREDEASYHGEIIKFPPVRLFPKPLQKPGPKIILGAHDPKYALKRVARYADGWCPGGLSAEQARTCIPQIRQMAQAYGRDPAALEFSVLLPTTPALDLMKRYEEAGVTRIVVGAARTAHGDAAEAMKEAATVIERAQKL
ncbi:MAG: TIGR03619 family F420-dependent LLM class oxidoreductase, partial [Candidatus Binataceae bacterium]